MTGIPHADTKQQPASTFQAIVASSTPRKVLISETEYALLQELRNLFDKGKHHLMQIGYRDGKYFVYHVCLHTTLQAVLTDGK